MKTRIFLSIAGLIGLAFASCSTNDNADSPYVSVRVEDSKMWSLMDVNSGKIVMNDEFFAPSSNVVNGSFFVENDNQEFDLYNLKDTKNKLNRSSYSIITNFNNDGFAIVRVKDEPWQIINTEGTVLTTLDNNLMVLSGFNDDGMAKIMNKDRMIGYVNTRGEQPIKPRYKFGTIFSDGVAFVLTKQEENHNYFAAIDSTATTLFTFSDAKYSDVGLFNDGYMFAVEGDHSVLLDKAGKKVMNVCGGTNISKLSYRDGKIIYCDGKYYGVKDLKDKILIRAKYQALQFQSDGDLLAKNNNHKYGVVTSEDKIVMPFDYDELYYVAKNRYITKSGNVYVMIAEDGQEIGEKAFSSFSNRTGSSSEYSKVALITSNSNNSSLEDLIQNFLLDVNNPDTEASDDYAYTDTANESASQDSASADFDTPDKFISYIRVNGVPTGGSLSQFHWLSDYKYGSDAFAGISKPQLRILRNAIYAMHGYKFKSADLADYFARFNDYSGFTSNIPNLSKTEIHNVESIKRYE